MKNTLDPSASCSCNDPGCCAPRPANRWKKIALYAIVVIAAGIILYKFLTPAPAPACGSEGCCTDNKGCTNTK